MDRQLLHRYHEQADEEAFAELVARHESYLIGICRGICGNAADADDALQATLLVLAQQAGGLWPQASVRGWMAGIARRCAKAVRRRRQRDQHGQLPESISDAGPDRSDRQGDGFRQLHQALAELPPDLAELIDCCYLQELSNRAAAERLGIPAGSVSRHLAKGLGLLRQQFVAQGWQARDLGICLGSVTGVASTVTIAQGVVMGLHSTSTVMKAVATIGLAACTSLASIAAATPEQPAEARVEFGKAFMVHEQQLWERHWHPHSKQWHWTRHGAPEGTRLPSACGPLILDSKVFVIPSDGQLWERHFHETSKRWLWERHGAPDHERLTGTPTSAIDNEKFFVTSKSGKLYERLYQDGHWLWVAHGDLPTRKPTQARSKTERPRAEAQEGTVLQVLERKTRQEGRVRGHSEPKP